MLFRDAHFGSQRFDALLLVDESPAGQIARNEFFGVAVVNVTAPAQTITVTLSLVTQAPTVSAVAPQVILPVTLSLIVALPVVEGVTDNDEGFFGGYSFPDYRRYKKERERSERERLGITTEKQSAQIAEEVITRAREQSKELPKYTLYASAIDSFSLTLGNLGQTLADERAEIERLAALKKQAETEARLLEFAQYIDWKAKEHKKAIAIISSVVLVL